MVIRRSEALRYEKNQDSIDSGGPSKRIQSIDDGKPISNDSVFNAKRWRRKSSRAQPLVVQQKSPRPSLFASLDKQLKNKVQRASWFAYSSLLRAKTLSSGGIQMTEFKPRVRRSVLKHLGEMTDPQVKDFWTKQGAVASSATNYGLNSGDARARTYEPHGLILKHLTNLKTTVNQQRKHMKLAAQRQAALEQRRIAAFIDELAEDSKYPLDFLVKYGPELYRQHRVEMRLEKNRKMEKNRRELAILEKIYKEKKKLRTTPKTTLTSPKFEAVPTSTLVDEEETTVYQTEEPFGDSEEWPVKEAITKVFPKSRSTLDGVSLWSRNRKHKSYSKKLRKTSTNPPCIKLLFDKSLLQDVEKASGMLGLNYEEEEEQQVTDGAAFVPHMEEEKSLVAVPKKCFFRDYVMGQKYQKTICLKNTKSETLHIHFVDIKGSNLGDSGHFWTSPVDNHKLKTGLCMKIDVMFQCTNSRKSIKADLRVIVTHPSHERKLFTVPIICLPSAPKPGVRHNLLKFAPVARTREKPVEMFMKIYNDGAEPCNALIQLKEDSILSTSVLYSFSTIEGNKALGSDSRGFKRSESQSKNPKTFVRDMVDYALVRALCPFRMQYPSFLEVPPKTEIKIPIKFFAKYAPNVREHSALYTVAFEGKYLKKIEEIVICKASVKRALVVVSPKVLNMGEVLLGGELQQDIFYIKNYSCLPASVKVFLPSVLQDQVTVDPPTPIIPAYSTATIVLRVMLSPEFNPEGTKYYNKSNNKMLFPVKLLLINHDVIKLPVFFTVATALHLSIHPPSLNLGEVFIHETLVAPFYLTNHSNSSHLFAFTNVPKYAMIQPNYGFGFIGGGETLKLHCLYCPDEELVTKLKENGETCHSFRIDVTTMARLSHYTYSKAKPVRLRKNTLATKDACFKLGNASDTPTSDSSFCGSLLRFFQRAPLKRFKTFEGDPLETEDILRGLRALSLAPAATLVSSRDMDTGLRTPSVQSHLSLSSHFDEDNLTTQIPPHKVFRYDDVFVPITISAKPKLPLFELSAHRIICPPVPLQSFFITTIKLRQRISTLESCHKSQPPQREVLGRFEFFSNHRFVKVEPRSGDLSTLKEVKVYIIIKPTLNRQDLLLRAEELKIREMERLAGESRSSSNLPVVERVHSRKSLRGKTLSSRGSRGTLRKSKVTPLGKQRAEKKKQRKQSSIQSDAQSFTFIELFNARRDIYESFQLRGEKARIRCLIETKEPQEPYIMGSEILDCEIFVPTVAPDIMVITDDDSPIISFPPTPVGTKSRQEIKVYNISGRRVDVKVSTLNPFSSYQSSFAEYANSVPPHYRRSSGVTIDPEHWLKIPLVFYPQTAVNREVEYFEVSCNRSVFNLQMTGCSFYPDIKILPEKDIFVFKGRPGKPERTSVKITNSSEGDFSLSFVQSFIRVGTEWDFLNLNVLHERAPKPGVRPENEFEDLLQVAGTLETYDPDLLSPFEAMPSGMEVERGKTYVVQLFFHSPFDERSSTVRKSTITGAGQRKNTGKLPKQVTMALWQVLANDLLVIKEWIFLGVNR